jgi:Holliday junction resolvase-like predicted endonuclease
VTPRKQAHLYAAAQAYLQEHPELDGPWRIDVIAIQRPRRGQEPTIVHFEDALR